MINDIRDTPVSQVDAGTLDLFEAALKDFQTYTGDAIANIETALTRSPDFVLGHIFRALVIYGFAEKRYEKMARPSLEAAEALIGRANDREKGLIKAARAFIDGQWDLGCRLLDQVIARYPRDIMALHAAHLMDFFRGDALNLRNRVARALPHWSEDTPGYSYLLGMYAFGLEECNQYEDAERWGRTALDIDPVDAWSVHAVTHVMEMQGRIDDGIGFLEERTNDWVPDNGFAFHNWWHLSLFHLDHRNDARVLQIFDDEIAPGAEDAMTLVDVTSLLWRLKLLGFDTGDRFAHAADAWNQHYDEGAGYYAFNDYHAAMAFAGAGRVDQLRDLCARVDEAQRSSHPTNRSMSTRVGVPLVQAVAAYADGRHGDAVEHMAPVRDTANHFGGSHAQRDVITLTLIDAARRAGNDALARHYLAEREMFKPASRLGQAVLAAGI